MKVSYLVYGAKYMVFVFRYFFERIAIDIRLPIKSLFIVLLLSLSGYSVSDGTELYEGEIIFDDITIDSDQQIIFELKKDTLLNQSDNKAVTSLGSNSSNIKINGSIDSTSQSWLKKIASPHDMKVITPDDDYIRFSFEPSPNMLGKKLRVFLEREDNLSKVAIAGAFVPQLIPVIAINAVTWQPYSYTSTLMKWNHLLTGSDFTESVAKLINERIFTDSSPLFTQCAQGFIQGLTAYSLGMYGNKYGSQDQTSPLEMKDGIQRHHYTRSNLEAFRGYMGTTPTNNLVSCISSIVADNLKTLHQQGQIQRVFGNWSQLDSLNDETLDGIAKLMVGYSFNQFANLPGGAVSLIRDDLGMKENHGVYQDFNEALKTSIQYTLHNGYMQFFNGRGWSETSSYGLASGIGLLEIAYRVGRISSMGLDEKATEDLLAVDKELHHQVVSIGERAEAIASSAYQFVPVPENVREYAVPVAATVLGPIAAYVLMDAMINYYAVGGTSMAVQRIFTSATNGLVLGALAYVLLPYIQKQAGYYTQKAADKFMEWSQADKEGWIGYFAARNTYYKVSFLIIK
ncbi:hypothetical protein [uncultured Endozoicomonas sp.]|uniref:hypothetical protein n=1 Tax=uncultured Endozoicomonas sp. TaxID=432652 RepID=UPI00261BFABF|nr:hypothetical protein [uncultured Endozoicomonas sp.]